MSLSAIYQPKIEATEYNLDYRGSALTLETSWSRRPEGRGLTYLIFPNFRCGIVVVTPRRMADAGIDLEWRR